MTMDLRLGIDASTLGGGGGSFTHLREVLAAVSPEQHGFSRVTVWGSQALLAALPAGKPWLTPVHEPMLDRPLPQRVAWQCLRFEKLVRGAADVLFIPGGSYQGRFHPYVTMSRNALPFDARERRRYGLSMNRLRLALLHYAQVRSFRRADGVIFLTDQGRRLVEPHVRLRGKVTTIPHGVSEELRKPPRPQNPPEAYSAAKPFRFVYVSVVDVYKFQWTVAEAIARLRDEGLPVAVDFVGPAYGPSLRKLASTLQRVGHADAIRYTGPVQRSGLAAVYHGADAFVFASSCENMPNILLEAMAAGLPIACSSREPMPQFIGDDAVYFDPEDAGSIAAALREIFRGAELRARIAAGAYERARAWSWERCARETFDFLATVARR
jgi:glycosyltransferase involved in cell wall biosynthesis